jgi:heme/copper-type cytochrome/quinol oxidase subunit 3
MLATVGAGAIFMVIKSIEYNAKFSHHHYPETSAYLAIYFTMTGLHALHVLGGMGVNLYLAFPGSKLWKKDPQWFTNRVEHAGLFWHFVDLVWIFLFPLFYLL